MVCGKRGSFLAAYGTVLGIASQSVQHQRAMDDHMAKMALFAGQSLALQSAATVDTAKSEADFDRGRAEETEVEALHAEASALEAEAEQDEALALTEAAEADALETEVETQQAVAAAALVRAGEAEVLADLEESEAAASAEAAAEAELEENGDGTAVAVCEFIPLIDIACDVIGATAAVALQGIVVTEAAEASVDVAAAAEAREQETASFAEATEAQGLVASGSAKAASLTEESATTAAKAEVELTEAANLETEADALAIEASELTFQAAAEEAKAVTEESSSTSALGKSVQEGMLAFWHGVIALGTAVFAMLYFGIRLMGRAIELSVIYTQTSGREQSPDDERRTSKQVDCGRDVSYVLLHVFTFAATTFSLQDYLVSMDHTSIKSIGGTALLFALTGATSQSLGLHVLPDIYEIGKGRFPLVEGETYAVLRALTRALLTLLITVAFFVPLFVLESLIVWFIGGHRIIVLEPGFSSSSSQKAYFIAVWVFFILLALVHHAFWQELALQATNGTPAEVKDVETAVAEETTSLIQKTNGKEKELTRVCRVSTTTYHRRRRGFIKNWKHLAVPLELLIACIMAFILLSCFRRTLGGGALWTVAKKQLEGSHILTIYLPLALMVYLTFLFLSYIYCMLPNSRQES